MFQAEKVDATASSISRLFITASAQSTCLMPNDMKKNGIAAFHDYADIFRDCASLRCTRV